ncbi:hypothetical protein G7Z17_g352 [Cylindrodendrum hubeiense]|uniref:LITAF domain-containing protein n=1 Tax=Cylindrodendrum hubeiense TaxID=595255 RepID=A0A9P5HSC4_9HYPO|nr:hypothetical protein G7Z17_g352 [Cylindrodendrum hubeiense]
MSSPSPLNDPIQPATAVSPPSYSNTPVPPPVSTPAPAVASSDEKIAYKPPVAAEGLEVQRIIDDDNLPEVVPQPDTSIPEKVASPIKPSLMSNPMTPPPAFSSIQNGYGAPAHPMSPQQTNSYGPPAPPISPQQTNGGYDIPQNMTTMMPQSGTVTPLHLLGDQGDTVDCPFCERRSLTIVKKEASFLTHIIGVLLFFSTFCGVVAPYMLHWASHVSHICGNCHRKVAFRNFGQKGMSALGTPEHLRQQSRFLPAEPQPVNAQQV